jgi:hypothetical protein
MFGKQSAMAICFELSDCTIALLNTRLNLKKKRSILFPPLAQVKSGLEKRSRLCVAGTSIQGLGGVNNFIAEQWINTASLT